MPPKRDWPHGTHQRYLHQDCRCPECVDAVRTYWRNKKKGKPRWKPTDLPERVHGTVNGYNNYGCRCDRCLAAWQTTYPRVHAWREQNRERTREKRLKYYEEVQKPRMQAEEEQRRKNRNAK